MIRMIQSQSSEQAKKYFSDALSKADYFINDQEALGQFKGIVSERLGITGPASKDDFFAMADNKHPDGDGEPLTPRTNEERTVGYDINFHAPKSLSIINFLSKDDHISKAFQESVNETMQYIEKDCQTRVRKDGVYEDRDTGEIAYAEFLHQTARPVDGQAPDPHLHIHAFMFNVTYDSEENRFKAGKFREIKRSMPYYEQIFYKLLSDKMIGHGYKIRRTDKSFEIEGVPSVVIDLFSKRKKEIEKTAKEKGITDARELDKLGALTRSKKQKGLSMDDLKKNWRQQIKDMGPATEMELNTPVRFDRADYCLSTPALECVEHAFEHSFERASVMEKRKLLAQAFRHSIGDNTVRLDEVAEALDRYSQLIEVPQNGRMVCTTKAILAEEKKMIDLAKEGQGKMQPLYKKAPELSLKGEQASAINHILTNKDRLSLIRGAAGSGKTTLMGEAIKMIEKTGKKVTVVAPSAQASKGVLVDEGFTKADTVARLLLDEEMQDNLKDQVLWVDEGGLLANKEMTAILELVKSKNARLIIGGDYYQHSAVSRGESFRLINKVAGIQTSEITHIYRQKNQDYKLVVDCLSKGKVNDAFARLEAMNAVIEASDPHQSNEELIQDYISAVAKGRSALVVSPTHEQGETVTKQIRERLKESGIIGKEEMSYIRLDPQNLTNAEKKGWRNFKDGQVLVFNQNVPGIKKGSNWSVKTERGDTIKISLYNEAGETRDIPWSRPTSFDVYRKSELKLALGDKVRITRNGFDAERRRLQNGQAFTITSIGPDGVATLKGTQGNTTYKMPKNYGHLAYAHCVTSHWSQGKTVDDIFISQPASTFGATDAKQFYVSVSRARESVRIYTDDKSALLKHASDTGDRQSATELLTSAGIYAEHERHISYEGQTHYDRHVTSRSDDKHDRQPTISIDHEPGF